MHVVARQTTTHGIPADGSGWPVCFYVLCVRVYQAYQRSVTCDARAGSLWSACHDICATSAGGATLAWQQQLVLRQVCECWGKKVVAVLEKGMRPVAVR
jgi:hypothetical protein